jgi:hypothetical protein
MTPREKAAELVTKYFNTIYSPENQIRIATECALIAVDEILSSNINIEYYYDKSIGYYLSYLEYYEEVKEEINKL